MPGMPDGYVAHGLLIFSHTITSETWIACGMALEFADVRHADNATKVMQRDQCLSLLGSVGSEHALQVQWSVNSDYRDALEKYRGDTSRIDPNSWTYMMRSERCNRYEGAMAAAQLRRERVYIYLAKKCGALAAEEISTPDALDHYLEQESRNLKARIEQLASQFTMARRRLLADKELLARYAENLNPSLSCGSALALMNEGARMERSILENTFFGDGVPFRAIKEDLVGLYFDGHFHAVFVVRDWPKQTEPGLMEGLTSAGAGNYSITMNLFPCDLQEEVASLERDRAELLKQVDDPKKFHLRSEVERKGRRIASLMAGQTLPFRALMIIRVWDQEVQKLAARCLALKSAFQRLTGCRYHQCNQEAQARNLFFETLPGFLGGRSRGWDCDAESSYLADLLPLTSTFTGHLEGHSILLDGPQGGLVGLRLFAGDTPQHACLIGMRGAGKSSVTIEVLSQTDSDCAFTGIIEEGLSYGTYAQLNGYQTLVLRPGADYTWNYLDTEGLPLSAWHLADASALLVKLVGVSRDEDTNRLRAALMNEYLVRLYDAAAEDWENADEGRFFALGRDALAIHRLRQTLGPGTTFLDAFIEWRDWGMREPKRWAEFCGEPNDGEVIAFMKRPETASLTRDLVFSRFTRDEFPTHSALCSIIRSGRLGHHRSGEMSKELDMIATLLGKWKAVGGLYGPLVDGATNVCLDGKGLHVELGYLGESNTELKEVAGFLATTKMRQKVVSLPRAAKKRLIYEEVGKFLTVPGAAGILAENYAQFRKYQCWVLTVFQNVEQLERFDASLLKTIRANSTQFWFMRHQDANSLAAMGDPIGLPDAARAEILNYPLPEHQVGAKKAAFFTLFARDDRVPVCGTVRVELNKHALYVAASNGAVFDQRTKLLAGKNRPLDVIKELVA